MTGDDLTEIAQHAHEVVHEACTNLSIFSSVPTTTRETQMITALVLAILEFLNKKENKTGEDTR